MSENIAPASLKTPSRQDSEWGSDWPVPGPLRLCVFARESIDCHFGAVAHRVSPLWRAAPRSDPDKWPSVCISGSTSPKVETLTRSATGNETLTRSATARWSHDHRRGPGRRPGLQGRTPSGSAVTTRVERRVASPNPIVHKAIARGCSRSASETPALDARPSSLG